MFLKHFNLTENPFAPDVARPLMNSLSGRDVALQIQHVFEGSTHCLLLSGPSGVGKTTAIRQKLREVSSSLAVSWLDPAMREPEPFFKKLLADLGLDAIDGSLAELKKITEVYLGHQASRNRRAMIIADGLESFAVSVLRELDWLCSARLRGRPIIDFILASRSEDLLQHIVPQDAKSRLAPYVHARLNGFVLDETRTYIHGCLHEAGCRWGEELIPEDSIVEIQAFSQGIVADVNALCFNALNQLAQRSGTGDRPPRVSRFLLKEVGAKHGLRYDPLTRQMLEEALTPDAVQLSQPVGNPEQNTSLVVTSGGRIVAEVALDRPRMVLGRDATCDISLNSNYVSRYQNLFMQTPEGWMLIDLNSTNGSFVNGRRVKEHRLRDGDVIAVGIHQVRFVGAGATQFPLGPAAVRPAPSDEAGETLSVLVGRAERSA